MKRILLPILLATLMTIFCWTVGLFYIGLDFLLFPFMAGLFIIGLSGLLTIPLGLYRRIKKQKTNRFLIICIGLSIGFYFGLLLQNPIDNWDRNQRNLSGQILTTELEKYMSINGTYPANLSQLDTMRLKNDLPGNYQLERFNYFLREDYYDLDIPIPIFDRWHWNKNKSNFEYIDF